MNNLSVGLIQGRNSIDVELKGNWANRYPGAYRFTSPVTLTPSDANASFTLPDVTIGIGFHWERNERQSFRGGLRIIQTTDGLTAINDVELEDYVTSVISSEMSASCPIELLKAHAVISRSWLRHAVQNANVSLVREATCGDAHEIVRWYGRDAHPDFDVCADDHCQRYQGITKAFSDAARHAVGATTAECLAYNGRVADARFSKCCGGVTELYSTAWEN